MAGERIDVFVSYTSADRPWAEWIAWELEQAGLSVRVQAWDMTPGKNFVLAMHEAARRAERTVAVLSPAFLESEFCSAEWAAAFREDPTGERRTLVPVRVRACEPDGLLGSIVYADLVGLAEEQSRAKLLAAVGGGRAKPAAAPAFPGAEDGAGGEQRRPVARPDAGAAIFSVPVRTPTFSGRAAQLRRLRQGLAGAGAVAVHAIHGTGGVGKTQLAAHHARTRRDAYDVVWWLRAERPETLRADLAALAGALGLVDDADEPAALAAARDWLERNGRWLLVADNAPAPDALAELLPQGGGGHVVITSRAHADWRALGARPLPLHVWTRAESCRFLRERTGERDAAALDAVAGALGDLPLALEQAAAYASRKAISLAGYAERLRTRAPELFAAGRPAGYEHTVATVWRLAFDELAERPVARELLALCAQLAPERVPRELLEAAAEHGAIAGADAAAIDDAIELLLGYALLTPSDDQTFALHRLIGRLVRDGLDAGGRAAAAERAIELLDAVWPERPWEHEQWPACERLLAHTLAAAEHAGDANGARASLAVVLGRAGQYQRERAAFASARALLEHALALKEATYGPDHPDVAITLGTLGTVQRQLGDLHDARATLRHALAIKEATYGPDDPQVAITLTNLGTVQHQLGDLHDARATQQRALAINEATYGPDHPEVAITLTNLGTVQDQLGDLHDARATQQRALAINEATYGPDHPEVAITLTNLGTVQRQLGDLHDARATQQRALAIKEATYGPDHPEVAITLTNLGTVQHQLGELVAARAATRRAAEIFAATLGPEHPHTLRARRNLDAM